MTPLDEYLNLCTKFADIDIDTARRETLAAIKRHDKKPYNPGDTVEMASLEAKWYASLAIDSKNPDYSVYADPYYFCETWLCWTKYSKRYLKDIQSPRSMFGKSIVESMVDVGTVLDLGCGDVVRSRQINDEAVDLAGLHCTLGIIGVVEDLCLIGGLDDVVNELRRGGSHLRTEVGLLELGESGGVGDR
jgi:hypothetical protein